jgi:hypothetical protein
MRQVTLLAMAIFSLGAARLDLVGQVAAKEGQPIGGATAYVYTAAVKTGTSPYCPSCYPDCGKSAHTDSTGKFVISALDPELRFKILFIAEGFKPAMLDRIDPEGSETVRVALVAMPKELDPARTLRGRVIGPDGAPVLGAVVTPVGCKTQERRWWGAMPGVDPLSITNAGGEYIITAEHPAIAYDLRVEARGLATKNFGLLELGEKPHELRLGQGATVFGRLLQNGKPVAGVNVGLVQQNLGVGVFTGARVVGTDAEGKFTFVNVGPAGEWNVFGTMSSLAPRGATATETVQVEGEGSTSDCGDLTVGGSYSLGGRVILSDGKPVPPNTRLMVDRESGWDSQMTVLDANGRFSISGLPAEEITVAVQIKGYHLSTSNRSLDPLNLTFLRGRIDRDRGDLTILLEPGRVNMADRNRLRDAGRDQRTVRESPIEGVRRD